MRHMLALGFACLAAATGTAQDPLLVAIDGGHLRGESVEVGDRTVHMFRGIPFAAPPVGELRWRPPQPVVAWDGERACKAFAPACPQPAELAYGFPLREQSEDCLYLNLWTAERSEGDAPRPVMVWIHGGGNIVGGAASPLYDGRHLAALGVVLVTIQYRLGVFGWLAHPALSAEAKEKDGIAASGNYGLLDQIAALKWVQHNIAQFGGDPECVTIFGESAGAVDVTLLMASPLARGLFHRAIAQSGSFNENTPALDTAAGLMQPAAYATGRSIARRFECDGDDAAALACLRALEVTDLLTVPVSIGSLGNVGPGERAEKLGPAVDGLVLLEPPEAAWRAGRIEHVPFMAGSLLDDGAVFSRAQPIRRVNGYRLVARALFGSDTDKVLAMFPAESDEDVPEAVHELITTMSFTAPARRLCRFVDSAGGSAWLYQFTQDPRHGRGGPHSVVHGAEIPYVFGVPATSRDADDRAVSQQMMRRFVAFARTGDPNQEGLVPMWPRHEPESDRHLEFGTPTAVGGGLSRDACDLFDRVAQRR